MRDRVLNSIRHSRYDWKRKTSLARFYEQGLNSSQFEGLILAQDERWRRALSMQVGRASQEDSRERLSNT